MHHPFNPDRHHRRSVRLAGYDYSQAGAYFVTICTFNRECLFGAVVDGTMQLNEYGRIVEDEWRRTAIVRPYVVLDKFVVMPDHFHGILIIHNRRDTAATCPNTCTDNVTQFGKPIVGALATIIGHFKSISTKRINIARNVSKFPVWQRGFYDRIIRDEVELRNIRKYIGNNPACWHIGP